MVNRDGKFEWSPLRGFLGGDLFSKSRDQSKTAEDRTRRMAGRGDPVPAAIGAVSRGLLPSRASMGNKTDNSREGTRERERERGRERENNRPQLDFFCLKQSSAAPGQFTVIGWAVAVGRLAGGIIGVKHRLAN